MAPSMVKLVLKPFSHGDGLLLGLLYAVQLISRDLIVHRTDLTIRDVDPFCDHRDPSSLTDL